VSIASINIQTAKSTSKAHMSRDKNHKITYLLDPDSQGNEYKTFLDSEKYLADAQVAAKKLTGRKMQQKAIDHFVQEAVLNLEDFHTVDDVEKVFIELKKEFGGFEIFQIAVHRDEGYFYHRNEDLEYRPNRDIFFNDQEKKFYLDSKFKNEADLNQFEKRYNFHAHVLFSKFDMTTGKNPRLKKSDMSKIQTISAKALGMKRGELFSKAKRMSHWQLKKAHDLKRDEKKVKNQTLAKQKDLKAEIKNLRAELQELGAVREDYAKLEQINKELKERIKQKNLTEQELKGKINLWRHDAINWTEGKKYKDLYEEVTQENKELKKELEEQSSPSKEKEEEFIATRWRNDPQGKLNAIEGRLKYLPTQFERDNLSQELNKTLSKSVDYLLEKNTKTVEVKKFLSTETKEELNLQGFISDLKQVEQEHKRNYHKLVNLFAAFSEFATKAKSIIEEGKKKYKQLFEKKEKQELKEKAPEQTKEQKNNHSQNNDEVDHRRGFRR